MLVVWLAVIIFPKEILSVFTTDKTMISLGEHALKLYFFGFFFIVKNHSPFFEQLYLFFY